MSEKWLEQANGLLILKPLYVIFVEILENWRNSIQENCIVILKIRCLFWAYCENWPQFGMCGFNFESC